MSVGKFVCVLSCCFCFPFTSAKAEEFNCTAFAGCEVLGYTINASECSDEGIKVLCPLDTSKAFCKPQTEQTFLLIYEDGTISEDILTDKNLIGISYDIERKLAIKLSSSPRLVGATQWANHACDYISDNCFSNSDFDTCGADGIENTLNFGSCYAGTSYFKIGTFKRVDGSEGTITLKDNGFSSGSTGSSTCMAHFCKHRTFMPSMKDLIQIKSLFQKIKELPANKQPIPSQYLTDVLAATFWTSTEFDTQFMLGLKMTEGPVKLPKESISEKYYQFEVFSYGDINPISCEIGSILGGNGFCYKSDLPTTVSPVGIVFDPNKRLAVALLPIKTNLFDEIELCTSYTCSSMWGYINSNTTTNTICSSIASCPADGRKNTDNLLSFVNSLDGYYAIAEAYQFSPAGCEAEFCKRGKWFLPSISELQTLAQNRAKISSIQWWLFGGIDPFAGNANFWSSNQYTSSDGRIYAWYWHFDEIFEYWDAGLAKQDLYSAEHIRTLPIVAY